MTTEILSIIPLRTVKPSETDWLERIFASIPHEILPVCEHPPIRSNSLYVYNCISEMHLGDGFLSGIQQAGGCGLLHLGDEYLRGDTKQYAAFDYVIRMFPFRALKTPGLYGIPVGYTNGLGAPVRTPASERQYTWMFAGDWKADRGAMAEAFRQVPNGFLNLPKSYYGERGISRADYIEAMSSAIFAPSPAGNICVETCRPYEALHLGAIPVLPTRRFVDPFRDLFGEHPLPSFRSWSDAAAFVRKLNADPIGADSLQDECLSWWDAEQDRISEQLRDFIASAQATPHRAELAARFGTRGVGPVERALELVMQQNRRQIMTRGRFTLRRALDKVLHRNRSEGIWSYNEVSSPPGPQRISTQASPEEAVKTGQSATPVRESGVNPSV